MNEQLKPCICGGMAVLQSPYKQEFYIRCRRCGLRTEITTIEEVAVANWNNRPQEDILRERAEAAEARLADYQNDYKFIMSERCWDENHCTCVPHLRRRIAELEAENAALMAMLHRLEWVDKEDEYGGVHTECPVCHVWQFRGGHKPGCELEQVLKAGGKG